MTSAAGFLVETQNPDGGWGYHLRGMSYVEPTAAAALALGTLAGKNGSFANAVERACRFLLSLQHADGGWGIAAVDSESGWMTSWALFALASFPDARSAIQRGSDWLIGAQAWRITDPTVRAQAQDLFHIDPALSGWSWQQGTASWVHPTALAITALVACSRTDSPRVQEGIKYLLDRAVMTGGWNVGDPEMVGKELPSTIQDTAVALIALHTAGADSQDPRVPAGIQFLQKAIGQAETPAELAWGIYGLRAWGVDADAAVDRLRSLQAADGSWEANPFITAVGLLAQGST